MEVSERVQVYLAMMALWSCASEEMADLTGLPETQVKRILGELVGDNILAEVPIGSPRARYVLHQHQHHRLARMTADLVVQLRGAP